MSQNQIRDSSSSSAKSTSVRTSSKRKTNDKNSNKKLSSSSSLKGKAISNYFLKSKNPEQLGTTNVKVVFNDSSDDDFCTPKVIRQKNKLEWKINKKVKSKKSTTNSTIEIIKTNSDSEHLQMALALSKSQFEARNIGELLQNVKSTSLEQFGFKSARAASNRKPSCAPKRQKKRFKYITPILTVRTAEERESIIVSKMSLILQQPDSHPKKQVEDLMIISSKLDKLSCKGRGIFNLDNIYKKECFYVGSLNLPINNCKSGYLLKNWNSIPGRDKTPDRKTPILENTDEIIPSSYRSISPDLFGSDDEQEDIEKIKSSSQDSSYSSLKKSSSFYSLEEFESDEISLEPLNVGTQSGSIELQNDKPKCSSPIIILLEDSLSNDEADSNPADKLQEINSGELEPPRSSASRRLSLNSSNDSSNHSAIEILDENNQENAATPLNIKSPTEYNSAELNITNYIQNLLNKENFSFDQPKASKENELLPSSQSSSVLADEELNYSSHYATPTKSWMQPILLSDVEEEPLGEKKSTPNNFIVKTENITPMPNYDNMNTPLIDKELQKVGVKPLKRARGVTLLKYIYESTHPLVGTVEVLEKSDSDDDGRIIKRRKRTLSPVVEVIGDRLLENEKPCDLIFETKQSAKVPSCPVPLQIIWHNFVSSNPNIKESILLYEPLQLECLHAMLKELGFKFNIQDLLTFLDRKCITIRTAQKKSGKRYR